MERSFSIENASSVPGSERANGLLTCGVLYGLMFSVVSFIQAFTRTGFDISRDAISLLSLGDKGWIQTANFILCGLLAIAFARGIKSALHHGRAGKWGSILLGVFGATLITAGIFHADPSYGFPPGAPAGMPTAMSWHNGLHGLSFMIGMISLIAASFVFARRFSGTKRYGWMIYCILTGLAIPVLIVASMSNQKIPGIFMAFLVIVISAWPIAVAWKLKREAVTTKL